MRKHLFLFLSPFSLWIGEALEARDKWAFGLFSPRLDGAPEGGPLFFPPRLERKRERFLVPIERNERRMRQFSFFFMNPSDDSAFLQRS